MSTVVNINDGNQSENILDIIRRLSSSVVIGNCINKEKHDEYRNNVIFEYSNDPEVLESCDIIIGVARWLYSTDVNDSYDSSIGIPYVLKLIDLDDKRKEWCRTFAFKYIVDEYRDDIIGIINNMFGIESLYIDFYNAGEKELQKQYYADSRWQPVFKACILGYLNLIRCVAREEKCEEAVNVFVESITNPTVLMVLDYIIKITYGIVNGTDVEDFVNKFNSFNEDIKAVAMRYIDEYFSPLYREILYKKLKAGTHK